MPACTTTPSASRVSATAVLTTSRVRVGKMKIAAIAPNAAPIAVSVSRMMSNPSLKRPSNPHNSESRAVMKKIIAVYETRKK